MKTDLLEEVPFMRGSY